MAHLYREHWLALGFEDVVGIFTVGVSWRVVVADGERNRGIGVHIAQLVTNNRGTADFRSALPDDLGEMAPAVKELHERAGDTIQGTEETHLVVVHQVGDHLADVVLADTVTDVLAVSTTVNASVMGLARSLPGFFLCMKERIRTCRACRHSQQPTCGH